jgi:hypothetical protein
MTVRRLSSRIADTLEKRDFSFLTQRGERLDDSHFEGILLLGMCTQSRDNRDADM